MAWPQELVDGYDARKSVAAIDESPCVARKGRGIATHGHNGRHVALGEPLGLFGRALARRIEDGSVERLQLLGHEGAPFQIARLGRKTPGAEARARGILHGGDGGKVAFDRMHATRQRKAKRAEARKKIDDTFGAPDRRRNFGDDRGLGRFGRLQEGARVTAAPDAGR